MNAGLRKCRAAAAVIILAGAVLRLWSPALRPMHTDEAVNAFRFAHLLEEGKYSYDPAEFHGPTLHYATLLFSRLVGQNRFAELNEAFLRFVPAVFGILLVGAPFLFWGFIKPRAFLISAVLCALSPGFVFYSRYFIHEMPLVFFTACFLGCLWRYVCSGRLRWAALVGISAGLMHATKESCALAFIAAAVAAALPAAGFIPSLTLRAFVRRFFGVGLIVFLAAVVSAIFYSSFGLTPGGIIDSYKAVFISVQRAMGADIHRHPWHYYLDLLTWLEFIEKRPWNEDIIVVLSALAMILSFRADRGALPCGRGLLRFLSVYTFLLTVMYSAIPYKTPWCMLSFLYGMALLAGIGAYWLIESAGRRRWIYVFLTLFGVIWPVFQAYWLNFRLYGEPANPYVYAQTGRDIFIMNDKVREITGECKGIGIQVIARGGDYWPWPWYLRDYDKVGYWTELNMSSFADVILVQAGLEDELSEKMYRLPPPGARYLYVPLFEGPMFLRPGIEWKGYIRKDLYDKYMQKKQGGENDKESTESTSVMDLENKYGLRFSYEAMATAFEVYICHNDAKYAASAARAVFEEIDRLEAQLSRYIPNSDISRINNAQKGQEIVVSHDTVQCLLAAQKAWRMTGGAFDCTVGLLADRYKDKVVGEAEIPAASAGMDAINIDADKKTVTLLEDGISLDLGGIAKGYAIDRGSEILRQWDITAALLNAGSSTVLALAPPPGRAGWPVIIRHPKTGQVLRRIALAHKAMSASGLEKGGHIINPTAGRPVEDRLACWVLAGNGVAADVFSTAFMIMDIEQIRQVCQSDSNIRTMLIFNDDKTFEAGGL